IYADVLRIDIEKTNIGQDAAALGAAALAAVGAGLWNDFTKIDQILTPESRQSPNETNSKLHDQQRTQFQLDTQFLAKR
ncbi:MAG: hypothetical protein LBK82_06655, partial [Planctomycetaceae bacterium]|nr:hypothetical protein [Planctomycetaceae bacterium]